MNLKVLLLSLLFLAFPWQASAITIPTVHPGYVVLEFDPNTETNIGGYVFYWGTQSRVYTNSKNIGLVTVGTINGLVPGTPYFFAVTAYDTDGFESDYSDEVTTTVETDRRVWVKSTFNPGITNKTTDSSKDPKDGQIYFYTHFQWLGTPDTKYQVQFRTDPASDTWNVIEKYNIRPAGLSYKKKTVYCTYRFMPEELNVSFRIRPLP